MNFTQKVPGHFENDDYVFFWGGPFSNWAACEYEMTAGDSTIKFNCSEQQFIAAKALFFGDFDAYNKIMASDDPRIQKAIGRTVKNYDDVEWSKVRYSAMFFAVYLKFKQNKNLQKILLDTGNKTIVEASATDSIFGIGMAVTHPDILDETKWQGQNLLGKALMSVREIIRGEIVLELES